MKKNARASGKPAVPVSTTPLLKRLGPDPRRMRLEWISASQGARYAEVIDEDHASGWSQTVVYDTVGSTERPARMELPTMVVEYVDQYGRRGEEWRITRRDTTWVFLSDADTVSKGR